MTHPQKLPAYYGAAGAALSYRGSATRLSLHAEHHIRRSLSGLLDLPPPMVLPFSASRLSYESLALGSRRYCSVRHRDGGCIIEST